MRIFTVMIFLILSSGCAKEVNNIDQNTQRLADSGEEFEQYIQELNKTLTQIGLSIQGLNTNSSSIGLSLKQYEILMETLIKIYQESLGQEDIADDSEDDIDVDIILP